MIHIIALRLSKICYKKKWLNSYESAWLCYAVEKKLLKIIFTSLLIVWVIISEQYSNTLVFTISFCLIRSLVGGWHASSMFSCFIISFLTIIFFTLIVGPFILNLSAMTILVMDTLVCFFVFYIKPIFPYKAHIPNEYKPINNTKKNNLIIIIIIIQITTIISFNLHFTVYSMLGILAATASVIIEMNRGDKFENNRKNC